jgi:Ca2+-binding RTX toxin-like protein
MSRELEESFVITVTQRFEGYFNQSAFGLMDQLYGGNRFSDFGPSGATYSDDEVPFYLTISGTDFVFNNGALVGGTVTDLRLFNIDDTLIGSYEGISLTPTELLRAMTGTKPGALLDQLQNTALEHFGSEYADDIIGSIMDDKLYGFGGDDEIRAGAGNDVLVGDNGNDALFGGVGNDVISGGAGADFLTGGTGADTFTYMTNLGNPRVYDSTMHASGRDTILDFARTHGDKIDLRGVDADYFTDGHQSFSFIGRAAYSGTAGELRYGVSGGTTTVSADLTGDGVADIRITLDRAISLVASDFIV